MRKLATAALLLLPGICYAQYGAVFGAAPSSVSTIATISVGATPANPVPLTIIGTSEPSTDLYLYFPRHTNCGGTGQPKCTSNPTAGITATTTGTWSGVTKTITVASASGVYVGQTVSGLGITSGSEVQSISGTTVLLSLATTGSESGVTLTFSGLTQEVMPTLYQQWTNNAFMGTTPYNRSFLHRIEMDPQGPYDFQCYNVPIGQAIAGSSAGTGLTWSATANGTSGVTRFYTQGTTLTNQGTSGYATTGIVATTTSGSGTGMLLYVTAAGGKITAANVGAWGSGYATGDKVYPTEAGSSADAYVTITDTKPTGAFYLHGFAPGDGFNNPSTPANVTTAYTVLGSGNGYFDVTTGVLTGTGSDNGYWTLQSQWYGFYSTVPTCALGTLFPPTSALYDPVIGLLQYDPYIQVTVATDLASSGYCHSHRFGPSIGTGTFGTVVPPATGMCYATENIRQWNNALTSGAAQFDKNAVGVNYGPSGTGQLIAYEMGNEPDNYTTQAQTNAWFYRFSTYGLYSSGITQAWIPVLAAGSGQTPGTYTLITDSNAHTGTKAVVTVVVSADGTCHPGAVTITNAGTLYYNSTLPSFTVPAGGTHCTVASQAESWMQDFLDIQNDMATNSITPAVTWFNPSAAQNGYRPQLTGGTSTVTCDPKTGCNGNVPVTPNVLNMISPGAGTGFSMISQHSYPFGKQTYCPTFPISNLSRAGSTPTVYTINSIARSSNTVTAVLSSSPGYSAGIVVTVSGVTDTSYNGSFLLLSAVGATLTWAQLGANSSSSGGTVYSPTTSTTTITLSQPTNFATTINLGGETYSSGTKLVTASLADWDTITSHTWTNNVGLFNTSTTPTGIAGQTMQFNGNVTDTSLNGQPLTIICLGGQAGTACASDATDSFRASWPLFTDSTNDAATSYDQAYVYSGATINVAGVTDTSFNLSGVTIASTTPKTRTAVNGVTGATITYTTGSATVGASSTGGNLTMISAPAANITNTPLGVNGTGMDLVPQVSCPGAGGNQYVYPPVPESGGFPTPYCGYHNSTGYNSTNFNQVGVASTLACSTPTSCTIQQMGAADSTTSGLLTVVTGTASNSTINVPKNPNCNPQDLLTLPAANTKTGVLGVGANEYKGLTIGTYTGGGALASPILYRTGEHNSMSPAQHGISDTIQQALYVPADLIYQGSYSGIASTLASTGMASPAQNFAFSGVDGENFFTGESNLYGLFNWTFSPSCTGTTCINTLEDVSSAGGNVGPAVQGAYYGMVALFNFFGAPGTSAHPTSWLPLAGSSVISGFTAAAVQNTSLNDGHTHLILINDSDAVGGNVVINGTAGSLTTGSYATLSAPDMSLAANQAKAPWSAQLTLTGISGTTATFSIPCVSQAAITPSGTGTTTSGSTTITGISSTAGLTAGMGVSGTGIPFWATVTSVPSSSSVVISLPATASGSATLTFDPSPIPSGIGTMYNMPLYLHGFSGSGTTLPDQWVTISLTGRTKPNATCSPSTSTFQATVTGATFGSSTIGTAYEGCPTAATAPWMCAWGLQYGGASNITWDGSYSGMPIGSFVPASLTAVSHVFTVYVPPLSATVLDLQ